MEHHALTIILDNNCVFFVNFAKLSPQLKLTEMCCSFSKRKENI